MREVRRYLLCFALLSCGIAAASARSLTDSELATLHAWRVESQAAWSLAAALGQENNLDAIPALLDVKSAIAMNRFVNALHLPSRDISTPTWEAIAVQVAKDPAFDQDDDAWSTRAQFLGLIRHYRSPELFELYFEGAKRRLLDRRANPNQMMSHRYFWVDVGTMLRQPGPDIPNIDLRVASLLPLVDQPCDAVPLVRFLQSRGDAAVFSQIREMYLRVANTYGDCNADLTRAFAQFHTAAASQAMAQRVRWLTDEPPGPPRDSEIESTLALLGAQPLEAQCDMAALERDVMGKPLSPSFKDKLKARFDEGRASLVRLNDMSPDDLAQWVIQGRDDILRSSIERGADVNAVATSRANFNGGMTLLNLAITQGQWEVARLLITSGADVNRPNGNAEGKRPLHTISETRYPINEKPAADRVELVSLLLSHGAQPDARDVWGRSALDFAAQTDNDAILDRLIRAGIQIDARDRFGETALHYAAQAGNVQNLSRLMAAGADVNARRLPEPPRGGRRYTYTDPHDRETPLHIAVTLHKTDAAACLLDHGADIDARTATGMTPAMLAVASKNINMVKFLIDRGADIKMAAPGGVTAILIAHENGDDAIEALLSSHGAFLNPITLAQRALLRAVVGQLFGDMH